MHGTAPNGDKMNVHSKNFPVKDSQWP